MTWGVNDISMTFFVRFSGIQMTKHVGEVQENSTRKGYKAAG
jgi:hypothetical protein